ncbi:MAG: 6-hydroxymethylpterin diphosphokinase MptE-like protein [Thermincola sp.]|nr:6-hydroxymethylpterin diphosphokinase MptE-like protein [Thermincola sp.]MDT3704051.1 6-hydroxymethylpterin diphosphokinase MptE-like protein [Thermincola sp.]
MTLQANLNILKNSFPETWQKISELTTSLDKNLVKVVTNKKETPNLQVGQTYIHDKKNPHQEAKDFIEQFKNIPDHSDILFYGLGLGYHISAYAKKYPDKSFSVYEPIPEVFYQFLCNTDLTQFPLHLAKNIYLESSRDDPENFCRHLVTRVRKSILIIALPAYHGLFPEKHLTFFNQFTTHLDKRKMELGPYMIFQKLWTTNTVKNFTHILNSPNVLPGKREFFVNKPAILVASGPSLEEEIQNLREIRQKGLAYIFSVGTALNALVKHGIYPHAACTYDPSEENQIVCREVLEKDIKSIPLLFGSTVGYETVKKYPGPKIHMLISQDTLSRFCLKPQGSESLEFINDAPSIAVIALQLLYKLGFNPIILAGQNLAYLDGKNYADGSTYPSHEACQLHLKDAFLIKDVNGNEIPSSETYNRIRLQIENYLRNYQGVNVINTTKKGAHIEGTKFLPLDEVMRKYLLSPVVEKDCWRLTNRSYDLDYLFEQCNSMNIASAQVSQLLEKCKLDLDNIVLLAPSGDAVNIEESYQKFNVSMENLRENIFFASLITHMSRVELHFLHQVIPEISRERNPLRKARMMEEEFRTYLKVCEQDIHSLMPIYQELSRKLQHFNKIYSVRKKADRTKVLLLVCDGILTDGSVYVSASGEELKGFNYKDRIGTGILQEKGIQLLLINCENSVLLDQVAKKLGMDTITTNKKEIIDTVMAKHSLSISEIACLCSDREDWQLFRNVGLCFAPKDASPDVQQQVDFVLTAKGGQGTLWEIADLLTKDLQF